MNKRQYIFTVAFFLTAILLTAVFFSAGLIIYSDSGSKPVLGIFCATSCVAFLSGIILIIVKRKRLTTYEVERVKSVNFMIYPHRMTEEDVWQRLIIQKYKEKSANIFRKVTEDSEGGKTYHDITFTKTQADFEEHVEKYDPSDFTHPLTYDICFVFLKNATCEQLEFFDNFIKENIIKNEYTSFLKLPFPVPIIITENEIYYMKTGDFWGSYRSALHEALQVLGIK